MSDIMTASGQPWDTTQTSVCALLSSHNRVGHTVACLRALEVQDVESPITAVLVDDGSTDGTAQRVSDLFPWVQVLEGDGDLFWAASMARAECAARRLRPTHYLWLNDDVVLFPSSLAELLRLSRQLGDESIVVGQTQDPVSGQTTYGGAVRAGWHPLRFSAVRSTRTKRVDIFDGNVVVVPSRVAELVGGIDGAFDHAFADNDYALRASALGVEIWQLGGPVGACEGNLGRSVIHNPSIPIRRRIAAALDRRGIPPASQFRYYRRHAGVFWFPLAVGSYLRILFPRRSNRSEP